MKQTSLYARVSTDRQAEEATIESQLSELRRYSKEHEYLMVEDCVFLDNGYSGSSLARPGLDQLRDKAAEGAFDAVLILSPDRLARRYAHQALLIEELSRYGVEVIFINRALGQTPEDELLLQMQGMISEYEKAKILERSRRGKIHKARAGHVSVLSNAPYGFCYIKKAEDLDARYEIVEPEAEVVREIFRLLIEEQYSVRQIARHLSEKAIATRTGKDGWHRSTVFAMLQNPAYIGRAGFRKKETVERKRARKPTEGRGGYPKRLHSSSRNRPRQEWIEIEVPAIVSPEMFEAAREQLERNRQWAQRNNHKHFYLLRGLIRCPRCGYAMHGKPVGKNRHRYYYCPGRDPWRCPSGRRCASKPIRVDVLDQVVWETVAQLLKTPELVLEEYRRRQTEQSPGAGELEEQIKSLSRKIKKGEAEISRLLDAYQESLLELEELKNRTAKIRPRLVSLQTRIKQLEEQKQQKQNQESALEEVSTFLKRLEIGFEERGLDEKQRIVRLLVQQIEVDGEKVTIKHSVPIQKSLLCLRGRHAEEDL